MFMRVTNILAFTEQHRFTVARDFSLSAVDRKLLSLLYQPMTGAFATAIYYDLYHRLGEDRIGNSPLEAQRALFLGLGLPPNAAGRQTFIADASRLEAVGLMQVFRRWNPVTEETIYEYVLQRPLSAAEFFANVHLVLLLRDKLGKEAVLALRGDLVPGQSAELAPFMNKDDVTTPFYDIFHLGVGPIDPELETAWNESAPALEPVKLPEKIRHADMLLRFPRGSHNRKLVEQLGSAPQSMEQINYLAYKYDLEVPDICRLLDEDGMFAPDGSLRWDELNVRANAVYRQDRKREEERERFLARGETRTEAAADDDASEPLQPHLLLEVPEKFSGELTPQLYNEKLRSEPYTRILEWQFPGAVPDSFVRIFERIDLNYKLPEPVINVLIHYVFNMKHAQRLTQAFIDSIASNMLAKRIDSFARAVAYIREQAKLTEALQKRSKGAPAGAASASGSRSNQVRRKPDMPVVSDQEPAQSVTPEQRERMLARARKLKGEK